MSRRPRAAAPAPTAPSPTTGSIYGGAIDFKPRAGFGPSVARPAVPTPAPTDLTLASVPKPAFSIEARLSQYKDDPSSDKDLYTQRMVDDDDYTLRIQVGGLVDYAERKAFVERFLAKELLNKERSNLGELITEFKTGGGADKPRMEWQNGYQCGSPQDSWYQVTFRLDPTKYNAEAGDFLEPGLVFGGPKLRLRDIIIGTMSSVGAGDEEENGSSRPTKLSFQEGSGVLSSASYGLQNDNFKYSWKAEVDEPKKGAADYATTQSAHFKIVFTRSN
jgi:hypothetical protein